MALLKQLLGRGVERLYMNEAAKDGSSHAATSVFDIDAPAKARTTASVRHLSAQTRRSRVHENEFEVTVARDGDLMGECFFHVTLDAPPPDDPFELIERVEYVIGGSVIESYTGKTLAAIATFDRQARPSVVGNAAVLPLRLCTSAACSTWLPLIGLRFHEVVLRVTTPARLLSSVVSRALHVEYACLDAEERRKLAQTRHELVVNPKMSAEFTVDLAETTVADVDLTPWLADVVLRDLIVEIVPQPGTTAPAGISEIVLRSEWGELMRLDAAMAARAVPRSRYGIDAFDEGRFVYYLPFDNAPADPFATATLRVRKDDGFLRLQVSFAERRQAEWPECRVHVTARTFNVIKTCSGMAALAMFAPPMDVRTLLVAKKKAPESDLGASFFSASFGKAVWDIPAFLSDEECDALRLRVLERNSARKPGDGCCCCWLQEDDETLARLQLALGRVGRGKPALTAVPNSRVTYGVYAGGGAGLARHADEPLQGGAMSLLVYLNDVPEGAGGATKFYRSASVAKPWKECRPVRGAAVLFDVGASHEAEPVAEGHFKVVVACELIRVNQPLSDCTINCTRG